MMKNELAWLGQITCHDSESKLFSYVSVKTSNEMADKGNPSVQNIKEWTWPHLHIFLVIA